MTTLGQAQTSQKLWDMGLKSVAIGPQPPGGQILYAGHGHLLKVRGDGRVVDLLAVYVRANAVIMNMPHVDDEFGALLNKLEDAMVGHEPEELKDS